MWNSTFLTQRNRNVPSRGFAGLALVATLIAVVGASAGTLRLGTPTINNNQYTFPVVLQGDAEGVAALDFRLAYDPAVFNPVSAQSGTTALQAQKQVSSNVAAPGEFVVVLMGFNQNTVGAGEVVEVVLEKIGEPSGGATTLRIAEPTLATNVGIEVDSRGIGRTLRFGADKVDDTEAKPDTDPVTKPKSPDTPSDTKPDMNNDGGQDIAYPSGPVFVARADQNPASNDAGSTGSKPSAAPETGTPTTNGAVAVSTSQALDVATSSAEEGNVPAVSQSDKVTRPTPVDAPGSTRQSPYDTEISASQPLDSKVVNTDKQEKQESDEEKGRQGGAKYATLLLLAVSIPLGLLAILRIAGK